ncbi:tRNA lysidine(34) synthetase TilS [Pandoraea faecigallinarum]|uniref:tRNA(Ile)-lysidine synthase n=1 Tax=Pandoraea faecigallinarum TaxID=656179 RepID=A0A173GZR2_9BURK|nr:tRNA lysidine(34) synthetase TilS [Pandoraea faecigallinarum]ANI21690.1 tRNA lysidine(34) synthetase TilS [Pandoraea faecigallinarum]
MVLLDALSRWVQKRREAGDAVTQPLAIHIHHGLSGHADEWLDVCEREARLRGFAFEARRVAVPRNAREGTEGAARAVRYAALASTCREHGVDWLLTAHHANDQAETVLLQMLRGAGLPGVAAMAIEGALPTAAHEGGGVSSLHLLRPLLDVSRDTMRAYAEARSLTWVEDPSNEDRHYLRNALRHDVMPAIASHVPAYRETLARFARHAAQAQTLLDQLGQLDFEMAHVESAHSDERLYRSRLQGLDASRLANLLRYWTARRGLPMPPEARLDEWVRQIRDAQAHASLALPHGDAVLRLYRDELQWTARYAADPEEIVPDAVLRWSGQREWHLPQWKGRVVFTPLSEGESHEGSIGEWVLRAAPLVAKARGGGERWRARAQGHSRSLKHWYQSRGVGAWLRNVPVVWQEDAIVFVPRLGIDGSAQGEGDGGRWRVEWRDEM